MRVLFNISHPKDVNVYRNAIWILKKQGHHIKIVTNNKENTLELLNAYGLNYKIIKHYDTILGKAIGLIEHDLKLYKIAKEFNPDILIAGGPYGAHVGWMLSKPHIGFPDTERATISLRLMLPFTSKIYTPSCFYKDLGPKQSRYNSYLELAYLHPNYFTPDKNIIERLNLIENKYIILKISSLTSSHDIGVKGFDFKTEKENFEFIKSLENYGQVCILSEIKLSKELEKYRMNVAIRDFHSFVYFAALYMGEGASIASEAAVLGVPAIYVSTTKRGYLEELEKVYGLSYTFVKKEKALEKAIQLLEIKNLRDIWEKKREKLLKEKIDTTKFIVKCIEKYNK